MTLRVVAAAAVLVSAAVHLYMWFDGTREDDVLGPSFLLNAVGGAAIAVLLLARRHWIPPLLAVGFGVSTLAAFVITTMVEVFGVTSTWEGWEVWTAAASEVVAVVAGAMLLLADNPLRSRRQSQHHTAVGRPHLH